MNFINKFFKKKEKKKICAMAYCYNEVPKDHKRRYCNNHRQICSMCNEADISYSVNGEGFCGSCYIKRNDEHAIKEIVELWKANISTIKSWNDMARIIVENWPKR